MVNGLGQVVPEENVDDDVGVSNKLVWRMQVGDIEEEDGVLVNGFWRSISVHDAGMVVKGLAESTPGEKIFRPELEDE